MQSLDVHVLSQYEHLSPAEQKVADYFLANRHGIYALSISEMSEAADVSPATWVRFCKSLGFSGLKELKQALFDSVGQGQTNDASPIVFADIKDYKDAEDVILSLSKSSVQAIQNTTKILDPKRIDQAAEMMYRAKKISLFGVGASSLVAADFSFKLIRIGFPVSFVDDLHTQRTLAATLTPDDLAIFVSHSGRTKDILHLQELVKENACPDLAVTSMGKNPLAQAADLVLPTSSPEISRRSSAMSSRLAQLFVFDCLFTRLANVHYEDVEPNLERSYDVAAPHRVSP